MSSGFVIPGISHGELLKRIMISNLFDIQDDKEDNLVPGVIISLVLNKTHKQYAMKKRVALAKMINIPADDVAHAKVAPRIILMKTADTDNAWFWSTAQSVTNPELVLDAIIKILGDTYTYYSEQDEMYQTYLGKEDIDESKTFKQHLDEALDDIDNDERLCITKK